ncbi:hypothetical protein [Spiroplasma endosymbiont of Amphimallon solstitiale]|uniref:hypothetical protein n=1 Tax=Spiroplasma endosymbiont of Amphimallon solstitiale TaxID=3066288 RepID=UPI00313C1FF1
MREIRISHYKLGLVEQRINIWFTNEKMLIDNENKTLKFDNLKMNMYRTEDNKSIPGSEYYITVTIKYQVK